MSSLSFLENLHDVIDSRSRGVGEQSGGLQFSRWGYPHHGTARVIESTAPWNGSLPMPAYDEKKVGKITSRLDALTDEQLRRARDYERRNKNRARLVHELDRKIRGAS